MRQLQILLETIRVFSVYYCLTLWSNHCSKVSAYIWHWIPYLSLCPFPLTSYCCLLGSLCFYKIRLVLCPSRLTDCGQTQTGLCEWAQLSTLQGHTIWLASLWTEGLLTAPQLGDLSKAAELLVARAGFGQLQSPWCLHHALARGIIANT